MSFHLHPEAERELEEAVEYYAAIGPGLGYDLSVEIYSAITFIQEWSERY
ncbi:hypothetical protein LRD18_07005 [Halorhodospira halochloris]|nr:hypothetical protein [Halorhodospira halochloris]MCG5530621.1 hypothetical protein [Halorhodospira halochloris]